MGQRKAFYRQRIPEFRCVRKETIDLDIFATSGNGDRKIMQSIRIMSRPPSRITFKKNFMALFMDGDQMSQGYRTTTRRQFTFYQSVPSSSWSSFHQPQKDERLSRPWSHPVVLNMGPRIQNPAP